MLEAKQSGNVVEDFTIGNTRIKICDDFCRTRTSGEVKEILNRVARRTVGSLTAAATPDYPERQLLDRVLRAQRRSVPVQLGE